MNTFSSKELHSTYNAVSNTVVRTLASAQPKEVADKPENFQYIQSPELQEDSELKNKIAATVQSGIYTDEEGHQFWSFEAESLWMILRDYRGGAYQLKDLTGLKGSRLMMAEMDNEDLLENPPMISKEVYEAIKNFFFN